MPFTLYDKEIEIRLQKFVSSVLDDKLDKALVEFNENMNLNIRSEFLGYSLIVEDLTSSFLAIYIGIDIEMIKETRSFSDKNSALSFNQKVNLFLDLKLMGKEDSSKFQKFMEIRNKFMHSLVATSYEECIKSINGLESFIFKNYPANANLSKEEQLRDACKKLYDEIIRKLKEIYTAHAKKEHYALSDKMVIDCYKKMDEIIIELKNNSSDGNTIKCDELYTKFNDYVDSL